ncbi:RNA-binding S4 domain-containing protein [Falsarthrobacter nasiphocae]|uniref:Ribosome-associated heat shock protein Hsp15 n=1 Tax=Falsarthrobacter nasiphocae TaxID=189863 RepID=A0AAE3YES9_9MICC|nr:RNA-binding S4 domain-containing protein [Falsarthrobacter nasiphocae]MDR6891885.1 ribosome-associated heat shock protein Hsp15 [Falsarthrobacter nasiphocae]
MSTRIDSWLWAVRVYRTRSAATAACRAGHIRINDEPVKAATPVVIGNRVRVRQHGFDRHLEVTGLIGKRVSAAEASKNFIDHTPPREKIAIPLVPTRDRGAGRPTKRERRELDALRGWRKD